MHEPKEPSKQLKEDNRMKILSIKNNNNYQKTTMH